jgi:hypothetical protein
MRLRPMMAGAVCVLAAGVGVAGCSSASSTPPPGITEVGAATGTATAGSVASGPSAAAVQPTGLATSGVTAPAASAPGQYVARCQPGSLRIVLGAKTGTAGQQTTQVVDMTNDGSSACAMDGFPGTNLVGTAVGPKNYSKPDYTWPLARASRSYSTVTLRPGAIAHFDLIYLPSSSADITAGSDDLNVTTITITPPNDFSHAQLSWTQGVLLQDAATHPGTYITPVASGA